MPIMWSVDLFDTVQSTQDHIKEKARAGSLEGSVVQGLVQTGGYGRQGRGWVSDTGNLYMSLLLRPACHVQYVTQLSMVASLAAAVAIQRYMNRPEELILKWPNDVLLSGRKCAGILLETELTHTAQVEWLALGMGINITNAPTDIGTWVNAHTSAPIDLYAFRDHVLQEFAQRYNVWKTDGFSVVRKEWLARSYDTGAKVRYKIGGQQQEGFFEGLDPQGNLIVRDGQSVLKTISAGEAHFYNGAPAKESKDATGD